jgi:tetratricopeptide (TPR) repeat protein
MTQTSRPPRRHRPSFAQIERLLPAPASKEAKLLAHVFECEACTDAAITILKIADGKNRRRTSTTYTSTFVAVEARIGEVFSSIFEQRERALALAEELTRLPDDGARRARVRDLARLTPWAVAVSLLGVASQLLRTEPERAAGFVRLAVTAAEEIRPEKFPEALKAGFLVQAHALRGEILRRAGRNAEAKKAFSRAQAALSDATDPQSRSLYCQLLSRLRRVEGDVEEAEALLDRAAHLLGDEEELEDFDA